MNEVPVRIITYSELAEFRECKRKWWLHYVRRLRLKPEFRREGAAALGTLVHDAMEQHELGKITWEQYIDGSEWADLYKELDGERAKKSTKHHAMARVMIAGYILWLEDTGADQFLETLDVERKVEADLTDNVRLRGKLDKLVRHTEFDTLHFIDYKAIMIFTSILRRAPVDEQFLQYLLLLKLAYPELEVVSGTWRMMRKSMQTDRTLSEAGDEQEFYKEHEQRYNRYQLEAYRERVLGLVTEIRRIEGLLEQEYPHQRIVPPTPNGDTCHWKCEFYMVCPMFDDGSRVDDMLEAHYEYGDPNDRYGAEPEEEGAIE